MKTACWRAIESGNSFRQPDDLHIDSSTKSASRGAYRLFVDLHDGSVPGVIDIALKKLRELDLQLLDDWMIILIEVQKNLTASPELVHGRRFTSYGCSYILAGN